MNRASWISLIGITALTIAGLVYTFAAGNEPVLGIELQGGASVVLQPIEPPQDGAIELAALLQKLNIAGFVEVLMTDVGRDGMLSGPNISLYKSLALDYPGIKIQASGGVATIEDVVLLSIPEISGVIVGRALLDGKITPDEARRCWQSE